MHAISTGALYPGPVPGVDGRLVRRLLIFIAASIALHALTFTTAYVPGSGSSPLSVEAPRVLNAVLAPGRTPEVPESGGDQPRDAQDTSATGAEPAQATPAEAVEREAKARALPPGGVDLPMLEKWYTASELTSIAFPIVQPKLEYPEELAGSGITRRLRLKLFVDERGVVRKLEFVEPRREPPFETAATKAWNEVRFSPAIKDGVAVKSQKLLELDFVPN